MKVLQNLDTDSHGGPTSLYTCSSVQGSSCPTSSPEFGVSCSLEHNHSDLGEMKSQKRFKLHFLVEHVKHYFKYLLTICISLLGWW